jgi:hypothetical protein
VLADLIREVPEWEAAAKFKLNTNQVKDLHEHAGKGAGLLQSGPVVLITKLVVHVVAKRVNDAHEQACVSCDNYDVQGRVRSETQGACKMSLRQLILQVINLALL